MLAAADTKALFFSDSVNRLELALEYLVTLLSILFVTRLILVDSHANLIIAPLFINFVASPLIDLCFSDTAAFMKGTSRALLNQSRQDRYWTSGEWLAALLFAIITVYHVLCRARVHQQIEGHRAKFPTRQTPWSVSEKVTTAFILDHVAATTCKASSKKKANHSTGCISTATTTTDDETSAGSS